MKRLINLLMLLTAITASARDLSDCQKWGYAPNDYSKLTTISFLTTPGAYGEGVKMPRSAEFADCTIEGVSVPVVMTSMKNLRCVVATDAKFSKVLAEVNVPDGQLKKGYNDIAFDEPIAVPDQDVYVGYTYTTTQNGASLMVYDTKADGALYLYMSGGWLDYSPYQMGVSGLQVIIGNQNLQEYNVAFRSVEWHNVLCGTNTIKATVRSSSQHAIERFSYSVTIDGKPQTGEVVLDSPIPEGMDKSAEVTITFDAPEDARKFDAMLSIDAIGDAENAQTDGPLTAHMSSVSRKVERHSVVEESTGTECGFCTRGWLGMETLRERYPESFLGIAIHRYNASDPMYNLKYAKVGFIGAPECIIDRNTPTLDPYNGGDFRETIMDEFDYMQQLLPDVEVSVKGVLSEDRKSVAAEAEVEFLGEAEGYSLAYVVTADGLTPKAGASNLALWLQTNYYYSMDPDAAINPAFPELAMFCRGGEKGQEKVALTFNDAMIASSWDANGKAIAPALAEKHYAAGSKAEGQYKLTLLNTPELLTTLDYEQLYVTALVIDDKGRIANAVRAKVEQSADGVVSVENGSNETTAYYTLDGRRMTGASKGLCVKQEGGRTRVVLNK